MTPPCFARDYSAPATHAVSVETHRLRTSDAELDRAASRKPSWVAIRESRMVSSPRGKLIDLIASPYSRPSRCLSISSLPRISIHSFQLIQAFGRSTAFVRNWASLSLNRCRMYDLYLGTSRRTRPLPSRRCRPCRSSHSLHSDFRFLVPEKRKSFVISAISAVKDLGRKGSRCRPAFATLRLGKGDHHQIAAATAPRNSDRHRIRRRSLPS